MGILSKLRRNGRTASALAAASVPEGKRIYAIGDIHGRLDLLDRLLATIAEDDAGRPGESQIIFLGDLIDRGPESAQVIERAMHLRKARPDTLFLLGNHEEVFLKAVREGDLKALAFFVRIGGRETILSYGLGEQEYNDASFEELLELLRARVPQQHFDFLDTFEDIIIVGDYVFVHAGVHPDEPLSCQRPSNLRWIREEFLRHNAPFEKIVVHGHTIAGEVEQRPNRIGLDTGAYASGKLSAMGFEGSDRWVLQAIDT